MSLKIRTEGDDLNHPETGAVAVENDGVLVGYAKSTAEAEQYIRSRGDDAQFKNFFAKKGTVQLTAEQRAKQDAERYAASVRNDSDQEVRQAMRRSKAFEELFIVVIDRKEAGLGANFLRVTFEEWQTMYKEYVDADAQGLGKKCDFQPLSAYAHKIIVQDDQGNVKRKLRDIFQNEVGVLQMKDGSSKIVILKDQGPGDLGEKYIAVPDKII